MQDHLFIYNPSRGTWIRISEYDYDETMEEEDTIVTYIVGEILEINSHIIFTFTLYVVAHSFLELKCDFNSDCNVSIRHTYNQLYCKGSYLALTTTVLLARGHGRLDLIWCQTL